jgi:hypothetical protein
MTKKPKSTITFQTMEDVRAWKNLKREELELEKLQFKASKHSMRNDLIKSVSQIIALELALVFGQKALSTLLKKVVNSTFSKTEQPAEPEITQPNK